MLTLLSLFHESDELPKEEVSELELSFENQSIGQIYSVKNYTYAVRIHYVNQFFSVFIILLVAFSI